MSQPKLRPYQDEIIPKLENALNEHLRVILVAACGSGKTVIAAELVRRFLELGLCVIFIAHRRELIFQTINKLRDLGIEAGTIMASLPKNLYADVQVASVQTLAPRLKSKRLLPPPAQLLIIDECHHSAANSYLEIIEHYPDAKILGLTATPIRADGVGLGGDKMFKELVLAPTVAQLIKDGYCVPLRYFAATLPDLAKVKIIAGDYNKGQLGNLMDQPALVGDIVIQWIKRAAGRRTVIFTSSVAHSKHIMECFLAAGIMAEHIDAKTPKHARDDILARLASGETTVVCNCNVLTEGWDCPPVSCIVLARPTLSLGFFLQMAGRGARPHPESDKKDCIIIDHAGSVRKHGFVEDYREWSLDPFEPIETSDSTREGAGPLTCPECNCIYEGKKECPECGYIFVTKPQLLKVLDADLEEITDKPIEATPEDKNSFENRMYQEWKYIGIKHEYKEGWAAWKYKDSTGSWPSNRIKGLPPLRPTPLAYRLARIKKRTDYWKAP